VKQVVAAGKAGAADCSSFTDMSKRALRRAEEGQTMRNVGGRFVRFCPYFRVEENVACPADAEASREKSFDHMMKPSADDLRWIDEACDHPR
jgi:hypothetical protein